MLYIQSNNKLPALNYEIFMNYIFTSCDRVVFALPNLKQKNGCNKIRMNDEYKEYLNANGKLLKALEPYIIQRKLGKRYFDLKHSYISDIILLKLCDEIKESLLTNCNLYQWKYPQLPEDLCFIKKNSNKCWMQVVAHEKECFIFDEEQRDIDVLNQCGVKHFRGTGPLKIKTPNLDFLD